MLIPVFGKVVVGSTPGCEGVRGNLRKAEEFFSLDGSRIVLRSAD